MQHRFGYSAIGRAGKGYPPVLYCEVASLMAFKWHNLNYTQYYSVYGVRGYSFLLDRF
jgi:hypothetical protein